MVTSYCRPKGIFKAAQPKDEMVEIKEAIKWVLGYLLQHKLNLRFEHAVIVSLKPLVAAHAPFLVSIQCPHHIQA